MNSVNILGRITSDLSLTATPSGKNICKFSIAFNEKYNGEEKSHFFNVTSFGKQAEFIVNYCKKGGRVLIGGKLDQNRWETKEGQKRSSVDIICYNVTPIDWKDKDDNQAASVVPEVVDNNPFSDDSIPF